MGRSAEIVRELFDHGFTGGRREVIDRLFAPDASYHQPGVPPGMEGLGLIVRDGLIVEAWSSPDSLGLLQQIGAVPEMALLD